MKMFSRYGRPLCENQPVSAIQTACFWAARHISGFSFEGDKPTRARSWLCSSSNRGEIEEGKMRLSIVIPTLNEAAGIEQNFHRALMLQPNEIIVADGQSQDGTGDLARSSGATVVTSERGRGRQLNAGARAA